MDKVEKIYSIFDNWTDLGAEDDEVSMLKEKIRKVLEEKGEKEPKVWNLVDKPPDRGRGCCSECGEGYDNEEEWIYNTECEICGEPIPKHLIIKKLN